MLSGHQFKFYEHPPPAFTARASGINLQAGTEAGEVDAGGPVTGGTELTITFDPVAAAAIYRARARERARALGVEPRALAATDEALAPFFALEAELVGRAINQSRCAVGAPPYTVPTNLSRTSIVCPVPYKPSATTLPLSVSLNGQQLFPNPNPNPNPDPNPNPAQHARAHHRHLRRLPCGHARARPARAQVLRQRGQPEP